MTETIAFVTDVESAVEAHAIWIAAHQSKCEEQWRQQHEWNASHNRNDDRYHDKSDERFASMGTRITAVERRIAWIAGAGAILGAISGSLISHFL